MNSEVKRIPHDFDEDYLKRLGIGFSSDEAMFSFLEIIHEDLEVRIGEGIAEGKSEELMRQFQEAETDDDAFAWLEINRPDYVEIVNRSICAINFEILHYRETIPGVKLAFQLPYADTDLLELYLRSPIMYPLREAGIYTVGGIIATHDLTRIPSITKEKAEILHRSIWDLYFPDVTCRTVQQSVRPRRRYMERQQ